MQVDPWVGKIPWRRAWQSSPVFLPEESHGQRSLAGYSEVTKSQIQLKRISTVNVGWPETCFNQQNVEKVMLCQLETCTLKRPGIFYFCSLGSPGSSFNSLVTLLERPQVEREKLQENREQESPSSSEGEAVRWQRIRKAWQFSCPCQSVKLVKS